MLTIEKALDTYNIKDEYLDYKVTGSLIINLDGSKSISMNMGDKASAYYSINQDGFPNFTIMYKDNNLDVGETANYFSKLLNEVLNYDSK